MNNGFTYSGYMKARDIVINHTNTAVTEAREIPDINPLEFCAANFVHSIRLIKKISAELGMDSHYTDQMIKELVHQGLEGNFYD